ncbi:uracil-DNA glycosylase [Methylomonas sp. SURF-2]|uniref:Type-4 uracil-DNA glycosylase n=1 Tax=Methylomonas subterranea TaxID=2952225 RepID=A0ABT1TEF8_9GAMM|nr:uracil-DNA glycosylase [Methylomonas sp. SURF-2]MCQ8103842.1 uracil-DNA glycosylase [Methylomonas sp. SURF-2]
MDESLRLQYLEAMGIAVWVARQPPVAAMRALEDLSGPVLAEPAIACSGVTSENIAIPAPERSAVSHSDQPEPHADDRAWNELQLEVSRCRACGLCETRTQTVFGVGSHRAGWMLIGEAPGQNEDLQGEPFVGKAGQLLNEMLRAIGLERREVFIANVLKCRPPANRDPQAEEVAACREFLRRQIALLQPRIILAVGRIAAQNLLETQQPLAKLRGIQHRLENIPLVVVHHPAYLLRALTEKAKAWDDLQFALSVYQSLPEQ